MQAETTAALAGECATPVDSGAPSVAPRMPTRAIVLPLGRLTVVIAAAAVLGRGSPLGPAIVAGVYCICLHCSFTTVPVRLGAWAAAATAAVTGFLATLLLAFGRASFGIGWQALLGMPLAVSLVVPAVDHLLRRRFVPRRRVLVVASAESADRLRDELMDAGNPELDVLGVLDERDAEGEALTEAVRTLQPDTIVLTSGLRLLPFESGGADITGLTDFLEGTLARVLPRDVAPDWFDALPHGRRMSLSGISTRGFDVIIAVLGLIVTGLLWPMVAILAVGSRRALFFRQARVGQCGRLFTMYKFRTMRLDAEPLGTAVWALRSDPRVGFGGRFLRRTHIDEIPQFWNVLKGDMSIVGPRPERPELTPMLEEAIPHWTSRQVVKPGMTGWAQVLQGYAENRDESEQKLSYDLWYIRHRNLLLDLAICLWTIPSLVVRAAAPKPDPRDKAPACRTDGVRGGASLPSG